MNSGLRTGCFVLVSLAILISCGQPGRAQESPSKNEPALPDSWSEQIDWRSIGPANMSGRITAIAVYEPDPNIWWAASASGGLLKTSNNGVTFEHQFTDQPTVSIGDVQVSATDPNLLWVGTGEANPRNSVSWGDGVYKSADGGKSWTNMGLKESFQTGRIAIHPENHDIVYVGALGRLWGPNEERGLFKTTDGGKTWKKILYVDDKTGVVDVQMNPKNPNELLVATYERMRDGFDDNDPITKYGEGSAIYKTVDGGETFRRLSQGLPSCKLGRIGLSYFLKNPNFVAAIVESEKIAKEPENAPFAGLRGENADVGARISQVTDDGPAAKAGLKVDDIVVSIDGQIVYSWDDLMGGIRKRQAGDTTKLIVSRDRKPVDIAIELAKKPERPRRGGNPRQGGSPFDGSLGGQTANMQGQQGENDHEYGGVYLSKDGGESWERINTLNPRPMYYSQIRFDPTDRKNLYVLGTSLHRSKDGGKTFTGDGHGQDVHVDHHALWIDPQDSRHMILGNDGGVYVTYNRMENWDHHNHIAIGQFYHVGIDSRLNYRVYGGLQDNGSWGGPSRVSNDSGSVNTDWFQVGGGDGFITIPDADDPDHIYFESQNGAMGRVNLRTGDRGFIRPRPPRGTRYRFNWKTPFILSPHNSAIHYSAGNHVFRSYNKGEGIQSISPEITNTKKGAGSAITESPLQAGVLYAGTTDGAVWMTKDGGQEWIALYSQPETETSGEDAPNSDGKPADAESKPDNPDSAEAEKSGDTGEISKSETQLEETAKTNLNGIWNGKMVSDRFPAGQAPTITFSLKVDDTGNVTGDIETRGTPQDITSGKFDRETGALSIVIETERGRREFSATVKGKTMSGEMSMRDGQFTIEFDAEKQEDPGKSGLSTSHSWLPAPGMLTGLVYLNGSDVDDPVTGTWKGIVRSDQLPGGEITFTIELKMDQQKQLTGSVVSPQGEFEIVEGDFKSENGKLFCYCERDDIFLELEAVLDGSQMKGDVTVNDALTAAFEATLEKRADSATDEGDPKAKMEGDVASVQQAPDSDSGTIEQESDPSISQPSPGPGRGFLGVGVDDNLKVIQIVAGSPAGKAGLLTDDVIQSISATEVKTRDELLQQLANRRAGEVVEVVVQRGEEQNTFSIELGSPPSTGIQRRGGQRPPMDDSLPGEGKNPLSIDSKPAANDPISGTWTGIMESPRGESELTIVLKRTSDKEITGSYETPRGEGEINEGTYDANGKTLTLLADNGQFSLEFVGQLDGENYVGQVDFNSGTFSMEFNARRTASNDKGESSRIAAPRTPAGKSLAELLPGPRWVSSLHASKFKAERCYVSFDGHRSNDDELYLFVTENFGKSWNSIRGNLPASAGSVRVLREDLKNENVLYLGCEFGAWVSIDRGKTWTKFKNLPTVAVHEFAQHPTLDEVVAATHGRSLWIADVGLLRQTEPGSRSADKLLFKPSDVFAWRSTARRGSSGTRKFVGQNPVSSARIFWSLGQNARSVELSILDLKGATIKRFEDISTAKGIHSATWDLRVASSGGRGGQFGPRVKPGEYLVNLRVDGELLQTTLNVRPDPDTPVDAVVTDSELQWWLEFNGEIEPR